MCNPWTWTTIWRLAWGEERVGLGESRKGRKSGDDCNRIKNKNKNEKGKQMMAELGLNITILINFT